MSQTFESTDGKPKRPTVYPKGMVKYLGVHQRGVCYAIHPDLPLLRFPDVPETDKFIKVLNMDDKEHCRMYEEVKKSKPYKNGQIFYIKSPEEVQEEARLKRAAEELATLKSVLKKGYFTLMDFYQMSSEKAFELAEKIGAVTSYESVSKGGKVTVKPLRKEVLVKNIKELLGVELTGKEKVLETPKEE